MESCVANGHLIEYVEDIGGYMWWHCVDCVESHIVYQDTFGG